MTHSDSLDALDIKSSWITVGVFDGVHRGHQEVIRRLVTGARETGNTSVVLTFSPHPVIALAGKADFKTINTAKERLEILDSLGVDLIITQTFDRTLADQTAPQFMKRLTQHLGLRHMVIGYDTALGKNREGNSSRLTEIGLELGYTVETIPALKDELGIISSTRIRTGLSAGNVAQAAKDLGRYFFVEGPVVHGDGRGHTINVPTANINVPEGKMIPAYGIYACWAWVGGKKYAAAANVGIRPTFTSNPSIPTVEAYLLDFNHKIYGQKVRLEFVAYLRPEEKYPSIKELLIQIQNDVDQTRQLLEQ